MNGFRLAVQLIAKAFNIIWAIGNNYIVARQDTFDGRIFLGAGILLGFGGVVDGAGDAKGLIVDEMDLEFAGA